MVPITSRQSRYSSKTGCGRLRSSAKKILKIDGECQPYVDVLDLLPQQTLTCDADANDNCTRV